MFSASDIEVIQTVPEDPDGTMLMPLEDIKTALSISGTTQDAAIIRAAQYATSIIENYCDCGLTYCRRKETHDRTASAFIFLWAVPIAGAPVLTVDGYDAEVTAIFRRTGIVEIARSYALRKVEIEYDGGYQTVPGDLASVFLKVVNSSITTANVASTVGMVKSLTIPDAISISYDMGAAAAQAATSGDAPAELIPYLGALLPYRRLAL